MLTALSIRDVVLIERLDLNFGRGLTVLTGETGAGKSILLDSLGLALGARAEAGLVAEQGLEAEDDIVLRRVVGRDGRSRAFLNDQPVGVALLRRAGALLVEVQGQPHLLVLALHPDQPRPGPAQQRHTHRLVEVQGQHEQMGLADPASHGVLMDAFGVPSVLRQAVFSSWREWRGALAALAAARERIAAAERDEEWLRHAVDELGRLAPSDDEEERLAAERQRLQQGERRAEAIAAALAELAPPAGRDRRGPGPAAALRSAARVLQRLIVPGQPWEENPAAAATVALERAEEALAEA